MIYVNHKFLFSSEIMKFWNAVIIYISFQFWKDSLIMKGGAIVCSLIMLDTSAFMTDWQNDWHNKFYTYVCGVIANKEHVHQEKKVKHKHI